MCIYCCGNYIILAIQRSQRADRLVFLRKRHGRRTAQPRHQSAMRDLIESVDQGSRRPLLPACGVWRALPPLRGAQKQCPGAFSPLQRPGRAHPRLSDRFLHVGNESCTPGYDIRAGAAFQPPIARLYCRASDVPYFWALLCPPLRRLSLSPRATTLSYYAIRCPACRVVIHTTRKPAIDDEIPMRMVILSKSIVPSFTSQLRHAIGNYSSPGSVKSLCRKK